MTKHLDNAFGLPHLDDLMREEGAIEATQVEPVITEEEANQLVSGMKHAVSQAQDVDTADHAKSMDQIYDETLDYAQKVMDLGFNIDPARAPRMFEVANGLYKTAVDAKNSKMEAKFKAQQLLLNKMKLELDRQSGGGEGGSDAIETKGIMTEDRNELIKRLVAQKKGEI
jgi:hypothetical protein